MARLGQVVQDADSGSVSLITTAETILLTLPGISTPGPDAKVVLEGLCQLIGGAASTGVTVRIRRGSTLAGPTVGLTASANIAAGQAVSVPIQVDDTPGEVAGQQYILTAQQTAATGNGSCNGANLQATI